MTTHKGYTITKTDTGGRCMGREVNYRIEQDGQFVTASPTLKQAKAMIDIWTAQSETAHADRIAALLGF